MMLTIVENIFFVQVYSYIIYLSFRIINSYKK